MERRIRAATRLSSREFNQDTGKAKRAAKEGPVFITDRGKPSLVLLSIEEYRRLAGPKKSIIDLLSMGDEDTFDFEPPRLEGPFWKPVDFD